MGSTLAHYRITSRLGAGGMGEVYRATDTKLGREVALKVLPPGLTHDPDRLARFEREARTLAALQHRNIVAIHAVEEHEGSRFLVMELIAGQTLAQLIPAGGMPLDRLLAVGAEIADALSAAHDRGVIHRDLKPSNVMVSTAGEVKVLDFGLARLDRRSSPADFSRLPTAALTDLTAEGDLVGTFPYMSPEQAQGRAVDHRTDLFSLGILLYEVATGRRPFRGETSLELLSAILRDTPASAASLRPELPAELVRLIRLCLEKDPERRMQSAKDVRNTLRRLQEERAGGGQRAPAWRHRAVLGAALGLGLLVTALAVWLAVRPTGQKPQDVASRLPRLAVLPFEDLGAAENAYFAAGMTEEIISRLAVVHGLEVISRTTVTQLRPVGKALREIGRELGVDYVLEGSVRWDTDASGARRIRITPQLIRVSDDTHLWAASYDRDLDDVFAVQSDIASHIVRALGVTLTERERRLVEVPPTRNPEAYQLYLRGLRTIDLVAGADLMHRAAELDPDFAAAHAHEARSLAWVYFLERDPDRLEAARAALARAQAVAPDDPQVRLAAGFLHYHGARDYARALVEFEAAAEAMPSNGEVPAAIGAVLRRLGRFEEALVRFERARELGKPEGVDASDFDAAIAVTNWALRRYPEVDRIYEQSLRVTPDQPDLWAGRAHLQLHWTGDIGAARATLAGAPPSTARELIEARVVIELWDRRFAAAIALAQPHIDPRNCRGNEWHRGLEWYVAYAEQRAGLARAATDLARQCLAVSEEVLAATPDNAFLHKSLGLNHALLGARGPALAHAQKAIELWSTDEFWRPQAVENLALVHALLGDRDQALALLPELLEKGYAPPLNAHRLRLEPWWDPLRGDPRFERLLAGPGQVSN